MRLRTPLEPLPSNSKYDLSGPAELGRMKRSNPKHLQSKAGAAEKKLLVNLVMDSGAFSAWRRGETLDIHRYIEYLKVHKRYLWSYVNMDVIPGAFGRMRRTQDEIELSAKRSYENLQTMHAAGLRPIPVFHQGERHYWLEKMLADGEPYIGISPYKGANKSALISWLDRIFTIITNDEGKPYCKTHGFGVTDHTLLLRYPWFSADSVSWAIGPAYGQIMCPQYPNGKPDYYAKPHIVVMSGFFRESASAQKRQFDALGEMGQEVVRHFLEEEVGISLPEARYKQSMRYIASLKYYQKLLEHTICPAFLHRQSSLQVKLPSKLKPRGPWHVKIVFASAPSNRQQALALTNAGANDRLLSYYDCREFDKLAEYVETGMAPGYGKPKFPAPNWNNETYRIHRRFKLLDRLAEEEG